MALALEGSGLGIGAVRSAPIAGSWPHPPSTHSPVRQPGCDPYPAKASYRSCPLAGPPSLGRPPRNSTPVARRGRKATGLPESAGLPNEGETMFWDGERWLPDEPAKPAPVRRSWIASSIAAMVVALVARGCTAPSRQRRRRSHVRARPHGALERTGHDADRAGDQLTDHLSRQLVHRPARRLPRRQGAIHGQGRREGGAPVQWVRDLLDRFRRPDARQGQGLHRRRARGHGQHVGEIVPSGPGALPALVGRRR